MLMRRHIQIRESKETSIYEKIPVYDRTPEKKQVNRNAEEEKC
jgi:hypothetical protein